MSTEPRTANVPVLVVKPLEIDEPDWCVDPHSGPQFKPDVTHYGPEHVIAADGFPLFRAMLAQAPFAQVAPPTVGLYVEQLDLTGSYTPDEVEELADALVEGAARLRTLARELAAILARGDQ